MQKVLVPVAASGNASKFGVQMLMIPYLNRIYIYISFQIVYNEVLLSMKGELGGFLVNVKMDQ